MSRALFIGRSVLDLTALVEDFPGPDGKTKALANDLIPGGSSLNAAVVFSHLGGDATLATSLGAPGLFRTFLADDLARLGVNVEDICTDPSYRLPLSTVVSTRSQGTRMIVNGAGEECARLRGRADLFTDGFDLIQLDQYERHFVAQHHDAIRAFGGPVVLDGGGWKDWSPDFLRLADIPIVSEVFCPDGPRAFAEMCTDLGITRWAITRGARGVVWSDGNNKGEIPALPVEAVDTMGAGDIFHGAFCHAYAATSGFIEALETANRIAARSCESPGTRSWMNG
jgi:sugar/nucleoside kinase (ribokinase family)